MTIINPNLRSRSRVVGCFLALRYGYFNPDRCPDLEVGRGGEAGLQYGDVGYPWSRWTHGELWAARPSRDAEKTEYGFKQNPNYAQVDNKSGRFSRRWSVVTVDGEK